MIRDGLLALGLLLSTATQLRVPGLPLGPGEIILGLWIMLTVADLLLGPPPRITPALSRLLVFWTLFAIAQSIGLLVGLAIEDMRDNGSAIRNTGAYVLVAGLSICILAQTDGHARIYRIAWLLAAGGAVSATLLLAGGFGLIPIPRLHFWIYSRFIGWSMNPNQYALLCTVLVLVSLYLAETSLRIRGKLVALSLIVPPFVAGTLTNSDSFILAMVVTMPLFIGFKLLSWLFIAERKLPLRKSFAFLLMLAIPAAGTAALPFVPAAIGKAQKVAIETMDQNDQAAGRLRLWREATVVGLEAGMLGLGPGAHLSTKQWKLPPPEKNEAHNTVFDLFMQGGLMATLCFIWISATAFLVAFRARLVACAMLVLALFVFSSFHLVVRHPIFWFAIVLSLASAGLVSRGTSSQSPGERRTGPLTTPAAAS